MSNSRIFVDAFLKYANWIVLIFLHSSIFKQSPHVYLRFEKDLISHRWWYNFWGQAASYGGWTTILSTDGIDFSVDGIGLLELQLSTALLGDIFPQFGCLFCSTTPLWLYVCYRLFKEFKKLLQWFNLPEYRFIWEYSMCGKFELFCEWMCTNKSKWMQAKFWLL